MPPSNRARRGLTLMELMVVIAILAILAALTLPAYQAARARANVTRSVNNLKQISLALRLYAETHGQSSPLGFGLPPDGPSTLIDLNMIPLELMRTGGTPWDGKPDHRQPSYVWFPPALWGRDEPCAAAMRDWQEYVALTEGNPALMLDISHNPLPAMDDPFIPKLCIVLWADGSVQTTRRKGLLTGPRAWVRR